MNSQFVKPSQRRAALPSRSDWKESRLVVAAVSAAGTATLFATVIMPLSSAMLTNKLEKLTEVSAQAVATAEELETTKRQLAVARAETKLALSKSPLVPDGVYPLGFESVVIGTAAEEVLRRLPGSDWNEDREYISFKVDGGAVFTAATYYFDKNQRVSGILYHFADRGIGAELMRKTLLSRLGEPNAQKSTNSLWRVNDREWVSLAELVKGNGHSYMIDAKPSRSFWGETLAKAQSSRS